MSTSAGAKTCIKCGTDCSGKPRTKDTQGRYTCKTCFDAVAKTRPAAPAAGAPTAPKPQPKAAPKAPPRPAAPPEPEELDVMSALLKDSPVITEQCPQCGVGMTADSVICTACGYNKETGRGMNLNVERAGRDKKVRAPGAGFNFSPMVLFFICLVVFGAAPVLMMIAPDIGAIAQVLSALTGLVLAVVTIIMGFRVALMPGILLIVTLFIPLVNLIYWLYFIFVLNESGHLKAAWAASILSSLVMAVVLVGAMTNSG